MCLLNLDVIIQCAVYFLAIIGQISIVHRMCRVVWAETDADVELSAQILAECSRRKHTRKVNFDGKRSTVNQSLNVHNVVAAWLRISNAAMVVETINCDRERL